MIETYITSREQLRGVIQIVDLRHKPTEDDRMMYEFLKYYDIPVIVIATKADKIPRSKWQKMLKLCAKHLILIQMTNLSYFPLKQKWEKTKHGSLSKKEWNNRRSWNEKSSSFSV